MGGYVHKPVTWNREAATLWAAGMRDAAVTMSLTALDEILPPGAAGGDRYHAQGMATVNLSRTNEEGRPPRDRPLLSAGAPWEQAP